MKKIFSVITILIFWSVILFSIPVQRGERPPIDLSKVADDAFIKGHIRIKIDPRFSELLDSQMPVQNVEGYITFGIPAIDDLNRLFGVSSAQSLFSSSALDKRFAERQRAWGFHLWYELYFSEEQDMREIIGRYNQLSEIEVAEPEYKKGFHGNYSDYNNPDPQFRWTPNDPQLFLQWSLENTGQQNGTPGADISMLDAWNIEKGNDDVVVAIIDQGIQYTHPDIAANMWSNLGFNFYSNNPTITPGNHGTHIAGVVAGVSNNSIGISGIAGGSGQEDGVRLLSCQVASSTNFNNIHLGMIFAADTGAAVQQNGWGYDIPGVYEQLVLDAIDYFNINGGGNVLHGGLTVFSAGNNNNNSNYYPAYYSGAFSVAATNNQDIKAYYSNYGAWVDLSAPGGEMDVFSARGIRSTITGGDYAFYQGTSQSAPHVSGVAALVVSYTSRYGVILSNIALANILRTSADNHYGVNPNYIGQLGFGRLNAHAALLEATAYLGDVMNPQTFTATMVNTSQIDLEWTPNDDNNDVLILWSLQNQFGSPVNGISYAPGQTITGGGTVLYTGSGTSFNHTGLLEATAYYYKAFSYNGDLQYSLGRVAQAYTDYQAFLLPFSENFNSSTDLPDFWEIADHQGYGQVWVIGTILYGGLLGTTGNYAYLNSYSFGAGNTQDSDLISPKLNLSSYSEPILTFTHYYRRQQNQSAATLSYSVDNGITWNTIQSWTNTTANPAYFYQSIPAVSGHAEVRFKWNYAGTYDRLWCVDDILITDASLLGAIEGTVALNGGMGDVTDVVVSIRNTSTNPAVNGSYCLSAIPGTYNVTASLSNYQSQTINEIMVEQGAVTGGVDFVLDFVTPPPPQNLNATAGYEVIYLSWYPPSLYSFIRDKELTIELEDTGSTKRNNYTLQGYNIYRHLVQINPELITETEYHDDDVQIGETYSYYVTALYDIGESDPSNTVTILAPDMVATPIILPAEGYYETPVEISITTTTPEALIYYTLNGDEPTENSNLFDQPFQLNTTSTVRARAFKENWLPSEIASVAYEINLSLLDDELIPLQTALLGAYPNPFNPQSRINFSLSNLARVTITIYNHRGQLVKQLVKNGDFPAGRHSLLWNGYNYRGESVGSGIYFYQMETDNGYLEVKKMALIK